jgi:hypothetical protein
LETGIASGARFVIASAPARTDGIQLLAASDLATASEFDPGSLRSERLGRLYRYWDERRGARPMPGRADIDPIDVPWILGYLTLHDVLPEGGFRFRVDASYTASMFGVDMTGRMLDEYPIATVRDMIRRSLELVCTTGRPLRSDMDYGSVVRHWRYERLILPLSADGSRVDMLMSSIDVIAGEG